MKIDKLKTWNTISVIVVIIFTVIYLITVTAITYSAFHDTILSEAPRIVIKIIDLTPVAVIGVAILVRTYCVMEIKKSATDDRVKTLEKVIFQLDKFRFNYQTLQKRLIIKASRLCCVQTLCSFPCFCPYAAKQGKFFHSPPTTLSSSLAEVRFASRVWLNGVLHTPPAL